MKKTITIQWGLIHGLNDCIAGYFLANYFLFSESSNQVIFQFFIYSLLAFGGQLPVGIFLDRFKKLKQFSFVSIGLLLVSLIVWPVNKEIAIIFSGLASAGIHVCGGTICNMISDKRNMHWGIFTAPGVLGLAIGGILQGDFILILSIFILILIVLFIWLINSGVPHYKSAVNTLNRWILEKKDFLILLVLLIICIRSFIYNILNSFSNDFEDGLLIVGLSVFIGKLFGGFLAELIGWKFSIYGSMILAILFFQIDDQNIYMLSLGIACMQSSVPITLELLGRFLSFYPSTSSALGLGTTIAIAGIPFYFFENLSDILFTDISMLLLFLFALIVVLGFFFFKTNLFNKIPKDR